MILLLSQNLPVFLALTAGLLCSPLRLECDLMAGASLENGKERAREKVLQLCAGEWVARALYAAAKLEIADCLQDGPKTIDEIAVCSQANPEGLYRTMHLLASFGVFEESNDGLFANNDSSLLLARSQTDSLRALTLFYGEEIHSSWDKFVPSLQTGTTAFELAFQEPVFAYFKQNPGTAVLFQEAMKEKSNAAIKSALASYPFEKFTSLCDVGGGYGQFMTAILAKYPHAHGTVFELPEVINDIKASQPSLNDRCELMAGDFFTSIPKGHDVYLLKSVLHDWDDAKAEQILKNCHQAMTPDSRLLIVEVVLLPQDQSLYANCMDLLMLAITGGKERTLTSFKTMLEQAGFVLESIYPTSTEFSILEARRIKEKDKGIRP